MKRYKEKELKRNKKENYRILEIETYDNISEYQNYFMVTDYNKNIIKKYITWNLIDKKYTQKA